MDTVKVIHGLSEVNRKQAEIIDDLFSLLMQHISVKEAEDYVERIREISEESEKWRDSK